MAFDGMVMRAVTHELQQVRGARISKIHMPGPHDVEFQIRVSGKNLRWLISADPTYPRTYLTQQLNDRPNEPPTFCMLLRKHVEGGVIERIKQIGDERILHIHLRIQNDLGDWMERVLVFECMGKHSNLILLNADPLQEEAMILDGLHHLTPAVSRHRIVLPGCTYVAPPAQHKQSLVLVESGALREWVQQQQALCVDGPAWERTLLQTWSGFGPILSKEIVFRASKLVSEYASPMEVALFQQLHQFQQSLFAHDYTPASAENEKGNLIFAICELTHASKHQAFETMSACLENIFHDRADRERRKQRALDIFHLAKNERQKAELKIDKLREQLQQTEDVEKWRQWGELLTASQHLVARGSTSIELVDYYDETMPMIQIPLSPLLGANEQAQAFFKKYQKLKTSIPLTHAQLEKTNHDCLYWDQILQQIEQAAANDVEEMREELIENGYMRRRAKPTRKKQHIKPQPLKVTSPEGTIIYVGKNNLQNDFVTFKLGQAQHWWLHAKDMPGSHVLICSSEPSDSTIQLAAELAAYYSKGRQSSSVPVDMTRIRHVRKPSGSKPGFVIYDHQKTWFVTPDSDRIQAHIQKK